MSSVSADTPAPTLLVCIHHLSAAGAAILENGVFCVNILDESQPLLSDVFAGRHGDDKFAAAEWHIMKTGAPRLAAPLTAFDCRLTDSQLVGTHHILFGAVEEVFIADAGSALIYANRDHGVARQLPPANAQIQGGLF